MRPIGCIDLFRTRAEPFDERQIALVETFATQAVIAIENVRQFREVQERLERETATGEVLSVISTSRDDDNPVFDAILESSARLCETPTASLFLLDDNKETLVYRRSAGHLLSEAYEIGVSKFPLDLNITPVRSVNERRTVHAPDIAELDAYKNGEPASIRAVDQEGIRTMLSVPLFRGEDAIGCINLIRREVKPFTERQIALIETFAAQAVIAIENARQFKALETLNAELDDRVESQVGEIERMGRLKRFLPAAVADPVVTSGDESMLTSHRALVATLFCDMRGFTAFCESAEPEETIEVLQTYHQEMGDLINEFGGGVDQRAGDGIMVIFNDPIPVDDPARDAVRLAVAMRVKMKELCARWKRLGHRLGFGVGISLGYATVGLVGSAGRFDYTASGTSVNTAARLCDMALDGEVLISPRVWIAVEDDFQAESRGEVVMKGIREPVEVFALT